MNYRNEIDGLRAFAVLTVVFFHAFPSKLPGGFVGVDIFFVISGFLITSIIFVELDNGTFSFADFLNRRIRRIFPALILVMTATLAFGWFALLAVEYEQLGKHIFSASLFVINFVFINESGYFDNAAETKLMLHLWSLAVEEQFYVFWPLALWFSYKKKLNLLTITIALASISFVLNIGFVVSHPTETFFWSISRFWELLVGSILAYLMVFKRDQLLSIKHYIDSLLAKIIYRQKASPCESLTSNLMSGFGFTLLLFGIFGITKESVFPGTLVLVPVLGALLIIGSGAKAWLNRVILMNPIAVWVGSISYPLYLWHWPLFTYARIIEGETPSIEARVLLILASVVLSSITYVLIERRFMTVKASSTRSLVLASLLIVTGALGWAVFENNGVSDRNAVMKTENQKREILFSGSGCPENFKIISQCDTSQYNNNSDSLVLVLGDSHARQSYELLRMKNFFKNQSVIGISIGGCPTLIDTITKNAPKCAFVNNEILAFLNSSSNKKLQIYLAGQWSSYVQENWLKDVEGETLDFGETLSESLSVLSEFGTVFLLDQVPIVPFNPERCVSRPFKRFVESSCSFSLADSVKLLSKSRAILDKSVIMSGNAKRINFDHEICTGGLCKLLKNGVLTYFDRTHINPNALR